MSKLLSRRIFKVSDDLSIICDCEDTRSGFRHVASVLRDGSLVSVRSKDGVWSIQKPAKICYLNRTWEAFEFASVLCRLADTAQGLTDDERIAIRSITR